MDTFNLEISFSKLKVGVFSTSLTGISFLSFSFDIACCCGCSADFDLLLSGPIASFPFLFVADESFFAASTSFLFWIGSADTYMFLSEYRCCYADREFIYPLWYSSDSSSKTVSLARIKYVSWCVAELTAHSSSSITYVGSSSGVKRWFSSPITFLSSSKSSPCTKFCCKGVCTGYYAACSWFRWCFCLILYCGYYWPWKLGFLTCGLGLSSFTLSSICSTFLSSRYIEEDSSFIVIFYSAFALPILDDRFASMLIAIFCMSSIVASSLSLNW